MTRCPTRFPYQMMFVPFNSKKMGVARGAGTAIHSRAAELTPFYLVLFVCFVDRCLTFFCHCVVFSSSMYGFLLHICYLRIFLTFILYFCNFENSYVLTQRICYTTRDNNET